MPGTLVGPPIASSRSTEAACVAGTNPGDSAMPSASMVNNLQVPAQGGQSFLSAGTTLVSRSTLAGNEDASPSNDISSLEARDSFQEVTRLQSMLENAKNVKKGAEDVLQRSIADDIRVKVEAELDLANRRIDAISKKLDRESRNRRRPNGPPSPLMFKSRSTNTNEPIERFRENAIEKDNLWAIKQQALGCIKTLLSYSRHPGNMELSFSASSSASPPAPNTLEDLDRCRLRVMTELDIILQQSPRVRFDIEMSDLIRAVTPCLADRAPSKARAMAYRVLRHTLFDAESVERIHDHHLDWYIVKTLTRDNKFNVEREQVLKLLRTMVELGSERRLPTAPAGTGKVHLSAAIMRALVAVAEHPEDAFKHLVTQTLAEILLIDVDLMARTGGMRVLLQSLAEGGGECVQLLAQAFTYIVDYPKPRSYFHPGTDLEIALAGITDAYGKGTGHAERMRSCAKTICIMLRTWSGLMYLCMDDMLAIRALVSTLRIPSLETREVVLDMFFDLLDIETPEWYKTFLEGRRLTMYRKQRPPSSQSARDKDKENERKLRTPDKLKLTDQYMSLLTVVLAKAGLMEALTSMLEETMTGTTLTRKALLLMGEVLQIANRVLPLTTAARIQTIPEVFKLAADYAEGDHRFVGTSALSAIDSFNRNKARLQPAPVKDSRQRANSIEDPVRRGQRQVEQVKIKLAMQMDDKSFQAALLEAQVLLTKDYSKWENSQFDQLENLIEGPLLNPKRLEEAIKVSKFVRRLMAFFHPFSHKFSDIKKTKQNTRLVKLGCSVLTTLMANPDGVKYLASEDEFLPQIMRSFAQLDPFNGTPESDPIFSKKRVEETLTSGYFDMLGTLSRLKDGIELMEKAKIFTAFYHLSELRSREDLITGIIGKFDYSQDGHPRIVLSKALTSSYKHIRLFATKHLGHLIQTSLATSAPKPWMLRLLLTQIYDPAPEVRRVAVRYLEEACESQGTLSLVVDMQPTLDHLGDVGHTLLLKFVSTPVGFKYLYDVGYIEREMESWLHERNYRYMVEIEAFLKNDLLSSTHRDEDKAPTFEGTVPPHFYGEMAKTELGCQILQEKGHLTDFVHFIRAHAMESEDYEIIQKLKSVLWAVGNIGATEGGLRQLEEEEIIPIMLSIAEESLVLSLRGTGFFVLGLLSATAQGVELMDDYGWEATLSPLGLPTGLCVPMVIEKFLSIPPWRDPTECEARRPALLPPTTQEEMDVITAIQNLANTVIASAASRSLARMKAKQEYRPVFTSPTSFYRALHILSTQHYRLTVRKYILELFDISLDANVIRAIADAEKALRENPVNGASTNSASANNRARPIQPRTVSIFGGRATRKAREVAASESEDGLSGSDGEGPAAVKDRPMNLKPVTRIRGFQIQNADDDLQHSD